MQGAKTAAKTVAESKLVRGAKTAAKKVAESKFVDGAKTAAKTVAKGVGHVVNAVGDAAHVILRTSPPRSKHARQEFFVRRASESARPARPAKGDAKGDGQGVRGAYIKAVSQILFHFPLQETEHGIR